MGEEYVTYRSYGISTYRTMKQIKSDYNKMLNKYSVSKVKRK